MKAVEILKKKGFNYIKVEAEINCGREQQRITLKKRCPNCNQGSIACPDCQGKNICSHCNGNGTVECECKGIGCGECWQEGRLVCKECSGTGKSSKCPTCKGRGRIKCPTCKGDWEEKTEEKKTIGTSALTNLLNEVLLRKGFTFDDNNVVYSNAYNDGSVDTEWTFTIHVKLAERLPEMIQIFKDCLKDFCAFWDETNAGLHISISHTPNPDNSRLEDDKLETFQKNSKNMLMGLYASATPTSYTRPWRYRRAKISNDDKYSAIYTHEKRFFEFRVFDVCYSHPERILDYIQVIASMTKFYGKRPGMKTEPYTGKMYMKSGPREDYHVDHKNELRKFKSLIDIS
jgi:hypothetical protein